MGFKKHRHSKDKLYIRATEWADEFGGYKRIQSLRQFKRLPFDSCCISLGMLCSHNSYIMYGMFHELC